MSTSNLPLIKASKDYPTLHPNTLNLQGYTYIPADVDRLASFETQAIQAGIPYLWGGKDPKAGQGLIDFAKGLDCSGWNQTLSEYVTHNILHEIPTAFPEGSYEQAQWLLQQGFKSYHIASASEYLAVINDPLSTNLYMIGFHYPAPATRAADDSVGHVWPMFHDHTGESYGDHGVGSRPENMTWFLAHCDLIVVVGPLLAKADWLNTSINPYASAAYNPIRT